MKKQLLVLGILPLMMSLTGCKNETPSEDEFDKIDLTEEVKYVEEIDVTSEITDTDAILDLINNVSLTLFNDLVKSRYYSTYFENDTSTNGPSTVLARSINDNYYKDIDSVTIDLYKDYYISYKDDFHGETKVGSIVMKKDSTYKKYIYADTENRMIVSFDTNEYYDHISRRFFSDEIYSLTDTRTEEEKLADFYKSVYDNDYFYSNDGYLPYGDMKYYKSGEDYLAIYNSISYDYQSDDHSVAIKGVSQIFIKANKDFKVEYMTEYINQDYILVNTETDEETIQMNLYHSTVRQAFKYGERVNSNKEAITLAKASAAKGFFVDAYFDGPQSGGAITVRKQNFITYYRNDRYYVDNSYYLIGGTEGTTYSFPLVLHVSVAYSLEDKYGTETILKPDYITGSYVTTGDNTINVKYHVASGYKSMKVNPMVTLEINENKQVIVTSASINVSSSTVN